jgi:hypothetical protein
MSLYCYIINYRCILLFWMCNLMVGICTSSHSIPWTEHYYIYHLLACWFCWTYFFDPEDGGDMFLRNVSCNSTDYMASYPRRWYSSVIQIVTQYIYKNNTSLKFLLKHLKCLWQVMYGLFVCSMTISMIHFTAATHWPENGRHLVIPFIQSHCKQIQCVEFKYCFCLNGV